MMPALEAQCYTASDTFQFSGILLPLLTFPNPNGTELLWQDFRGKDSINIGKVKTLTSTVINGAEHAYFALIYMTHLANSGITDNVWTE